MGRYRRRSLGAPGQRGFSLVETLVAVVITSLWVLAIVGGLLVLTTSDASSAARQGIETALGGVTGYLKQSAYLTCGGARPPTAAEYSALLGEGADPYTPPARVTVQVTRVQLWDPDLAEFVDTCPATDGAAQRLTVVATNQDGQSLSAQIVKAMP